MQTKFVALLLIVVMMQSCTLFKKKSLYESDVYVVHKDKVVQGNNVATVISPTQIKSGYVSPAAGTFSRLIKFKFSINEKDNEMAPGNDHWVILRQESESPLIEFGKLPDPVPDPPASYLPANYSYTFRVDMRPVLKQLDEKGYYDAYDGTRIAKGDFKGVYIAGAAAPLSWDFVNLGSKGLKMEDAEGDGIYTIKLLFNPYNPNAQQQKTWNLTTDISKKPAYKSEQPIVDALYNLSLEEALKNIEADSTFRTGLEWGGVWTRDISYSILLAFAYHQPDIAKISLLKKVKRKRIVQDTGSGGSWPVSSDRTVWVLAAWELYKVTGDKDWLSLSFEIVKNTLEDDDKVLFDPTTGLYKGESSFLDWREQTYPRWMNNADIYMSQNLGTNVLHYQANKIAGMMAKELGQSAVFFERRAETIRKSIHKNLWNPDKGYYNQYLYGRKNLIPSKRFEALGEALSILFDVPDQQQAASIMERSPLTTYGVTCIYPQIPGIPPYHNNSIWPFVQAYWNLAAAKVGNEAALNHGLASLYRAGAFFLTNYENMVASTGDFKGTEVNSARMLWSMAGNIAMVHRVFMGMQFETKGIRFSPVVPVAYGGTKTLRGFVYKNATLNISVMGTGKEIKTFKIDGVAVKDPFIADTLTGVHQIDIELLNKPLAYQKINLTSNQFSLPAPSVVVGNGELIWDTIRGAISYHVYRNGNFQQSIKGTSWELIPSEPGEYAVCAVDNRGYTSFISEPIYYKGNLQTQILEIESVVSPSPLAYTQFTGTGFVELSTESNQDITIPVTVEKDGIYNIDFRYSNGSGPWNTDNKCAIRSLYVNKEHVGAVVFPQRGTDEWSNWGYSNNYNVTLRKGVNQVRLKFDTWSVNMNVDVNRAMIDHVRISQK
ncbi:MAG: glycogen debranching protein [Bacteroidota bacterium]|jgi:hypothetical protein